MIHPPPPAELLDHAIAQCLPENIGTRTVEQVHREYADACRAVGYTPLGYGDFRQVLDFRAGRSDVDPSLPLLTSIARAWATREPCAPLEGGYEEYRHACWLRGLEPMDLGTFAHAFALARTKSDAKPRSVKPDRDGKVDLLEAALWRCDDPELDAEDIDRIYLDYVRACEEAGIAPASPAQFTDAVDARWLNPGRPEEIMFDFAVFSESRVGGRSARKTWENYCEACRRKGFTPRSYDDFLEHVELRTFLGGPTRSATVGTPPRVTSVGLNGLRTGGTSNRPAKALPAPDRRKGAYLLVDQVPLDSAFVINGRRIDARPLATVTMEVERGKQGLRKLWTSVEITFPVPPPNSAPAL